MKVITHLQIMEEFKPININKMKKEEKQFEDLIPKPSTIYFKLHLAKQEIGKVTKGSDNPYFKSKYADLNAILEATEPILLKYNLLLLQPVKNGMVCTQIIDIETCEIITSEIALPNILDPQKLIASITYFRRGTLQTLLSLQAVDDDGNEAAKQVQKETQVREKKVITPERFAKALIAIDNGEATKDDLLKFELTADQKKILDEK